MQYMLLIYEDEKLYGPDKNGPAIQEIVAKHMAFNKELGSARVGGAGLKATAAATTVRTSKGAKTVHDGPFAETREQLGGYYLIDVRTWTPPLRSRRSCRYCKMVPSKSAHSSEARKKPVSLAVLDQVAREAGGRIISALAARFRDIGVAEDAFGDACVRAAEAWPKHGVPFDPAGWLYRTAERKALDAFRRRRTRERLLPDPPASPPTPEDALIDDARIIPDERLRLIFVCCHPSVAPDSRAALTLRLVCGLSTSEIARAFLVPEPTLAQRLVRARRKIAEAGVRFEVPRPEAWNERLEAVLSTLEIAYAKSYEDAAGDGDHAQYATEVVELTRLLAEMVPDEPGAHALAALVRYTEARRPARVDAQGAMVPLSEQDPALWRRPLIEEADIYLKRSWALRFPSPRAIQAAIHGTWCWRKSLDEPPPWINVAALYDELIKYRDDAVVRLNRAVALAEVAGPAAAMTEIDALDSKELQNCLPYHAVRADLLRRLHQIPAALIAYDAALALDPGPAERVWLERTKALVAQRLTLFASTPSDSHSVADTA